MYTLYDEAPCKSMRYWKRSVYQSNLLSPHLTSSPFDNLIFVLAVYLSRPPNLLGTSSFLVLHLLVPNNASNSSSGGNLTQISSPRASIGKVAILTLSSLRHFPPPASVSAVRL